MGRLATLIAVSLTLSPLSGDAKKGHSKKRSRWCMVEYRSDRVNSGSEIRFRNRKGPDAHQRVALAEEFRKQTDQICMEFRFRHPAKADQKRDLCVDTLLFGRGRKKDGKQFVRVKERDEASAIEMREYIAKKIALIEDKQAYVDGYIRRVKNQFPFCEDGMKPYRGSSEQVVKNGEMEF